MVSNTQEYDVPPEYDVVIVGAGLTGLVAARRCKQRGKRVLVLEGRDRVGGRTETVPLGRSQFDHGARFVASYQEDVYALIHELGLKEELFPQYQGATEPTFASVPPWLGLGANLIELDPESGVEAYVGPVSPQTASDETYFRYLTSLIDDFPIHDPRRMDNARMLDRLSVQEWVDQLELPEYGRPSPRFKSLVRVLCRVGFSEEPENINLLWMLFYIAASGGLDRFQAVRFPREGAQASRLANGAQSIANKLCDALGAGTVLLNKRVTEIHRPDGELVAVHAGNDVYRARKVLVALSPSLYGPDGFIEFVPDIPPERRTAARAMRTPHMIVATVTFKEPFWRAPRARAGTFLGQPTEDVARHGLSGDVLSSLSPIVWMMDATSQAEHPAIFAFVVGANAKQLSERSAAERERIVRGEMSRLLGQDVERYFDAYIERDWSRELLTGGGPAAHFVKERFYDSAREILLITNGNPDRNVYFASTETALLSNGYMSGAVWSGNKIADEICEAPPREKRVTNARVREQAMLWCIRTILRAVEKQQPALELPALSKNIQFFGPGGDTLPRGPYKYHKGTFEFYQLLAQQVTLSRVKIEACSADVPTNHGFAEFSVTGVVNATGNPFYDIKATMVFDFNDPERSDDVLVTRDWLFMDPKEIDAIVAAPPGPFSPAAPPDAKAELQQRAIKAAQLDLDILQNARFPLRVSSPGVRGAARAGTPQSESEIHQRLAEQLKDRFDFSKLKQVASKFDNAALTYYSWRRIDDQFLLVIVRFANTPDAPIRAIEVKY